MEQLPGFILVALALAGSPGPATLSIAAAGAAFGPRRGLGYMAGIIAGMIVVMALAASGVTGLLLALPGAAPVIAVIAGAYFAVLAIRIALTPPLTERSHQGRHPSFAAGLLLSLVNPKGYAARAALFSGFVLVAAHPGADAAVKMLVLLLVIALVNIAWLFVGAALTRLFRNPVANRVVNLAFAILLLASVAATLLL
jgi:threonine/homoserine/homoserine lactone efflux protein